MTSSDSRLAAIFSAVLDTPPAEREAAIARLCAGDPVLEATVRELVAASERAGSTAGLARALHGDTPAPLAPGTRIGAYVIERVVATGGMGIVYCARDTALDVKVALKSVKPSIAGDARFKRRLQDEAKIAARLSSHPNIATVYAFFEEHGQAFIVSQFIEGETLRQRLARGPLAVGDAIDATIAILDALSAAHAAGIVHRDLKPENVMRTPEGRIVVLDFGIAVREVPAPEATTAFAEGTPGTVGYMSPEQLRGLPVDGRSDLFALGVVLYELLTRRHPFARDGALSSWGAVLLDPPTSIGVHEQAGWPPGLGFVIDRALAKHPEQRFASAAAMATALVAVRDGPAPVPTAAQTPAAGTTPTPAVTTPVGTDTAAADAVRWWQIHQAAAAVIYWLMLIPTWIVRDWIPLVDWRLLFFVLLATLCVVPSLRLSLWFVSRVQPGQARTHYARCRPWIRAGDAVFALTLVVIGLLLARSHAGWSTLFIAFGLGSLVVASFVEPLTADAALLSIDDRRPPRPTT